MVGQKRLYSLKFTTNQNSSLLKLIKRILFILLLLFIATAVYNYPKLNIISGYASKNLASNVFIAERSQTSVIENDNNVPLVEMADEHYAADEKSASAKVFGLMERETLCRDGLGCVLINDQYDKTKPLLKPKRNRLDNKLPFPYGNNGIKDTLFENVDYDKLKSAIDGAFEDNANQKTRTVLVAYKGQIIGERYIDGFTAETPVLGWSMTKSVLATLYGILQFNDKINVRTYHPFNENKEKAKISLDHLLRMQSGLSWDEDYGSISDVTEMLFLDADMTEKQALQEVIAPPKEIWNYSSGTSNLLSGILRNQFKTHQEYLDFPYEALIDKIGMHSMLIETDMEGNFVGSSYGWASTRDWAKFGILHLNRGHWNGEHIFAPEWIDYIAKPTKQSEGTYGAHWWLNAEGKYAYVPRDLFSANGFQGQRVFVIPSKDLVIVRTGLAEPPNFKENRFLKDVVDAIK
jgi:CubicO group peptidase (beta-lactamase class C family)